jgi:hypothetical protein
MSHANELFSPRTLSALVQRIKSGATVTDEEVKRFTSRGLHDWKDKEKPHHTLLEYALITVNFNNVKVLVANDIGVVGANPFSILIEQSPLRDSDLQDTVGIIEFLAKDSSVPIPSEFDTSKVRKESKVGAVALQCIEKVRKLRESKADNKNQCKS